jgi:hypothetical protein
MRKGFWVVDLKIDMEEVDGSSPSGPTFSSRCHFRLWLALPFCQFEQPHSFGLSQAIITVSAPATRVLAARSEPCLTQSCIRYQMAPDLGPFCTKLQANEVPATRRRIVAGPRFLPVIGPCSAYFRGVAVCCRSWKPLRGWVKRTLKLWRSDPQSDR